MVRVKWAYIFPLSESFLEQQMAWTPSGWQEEATGIAHAYAVSGYWESGLWGQTPKNTIDC